MKKIVLIPTYNEKENIASIIDAVLSFEAGYHILVIDDGSPDGTANIVRDIMQNNAGRVFIECRPGKLGLGTAYIHGFKWALERNWWPLLVDEDAEFFVTDVDGAPLPIAPESRPELKLFIENYKIIKNSKLGYVRDSNGCITDPNSGLTINKENVEREDLIEELRCSSTGQDSVGTLGLSIDCSMGGWSYKDRDSNWTIVALIRDGMIIEYEPFPRQRQGSTPFVRGVFVTSNDKNKGPCELLRTAEPPLHNHWVEKSDAFDAEAVQLSKELYQKIGASVKEFRKL